MNTSMVYLMSSHGYNGFVIVVWVVVDDGVGIVDEIQFHY